MAKFKKGELVEVTKAKRDVGHRFIVGNSGVRILVDIEKDKRTTQAYETDLKSNMTEFKERYRWVAEDCIKRIEPDVGCDMSFENLMADLNNYVTT